MAINFLDVIKMYPDKKNAHLFQGDGTFEGSGSEYVSQNTFFVFF